MVELPLVVLEPLRVPVNESVGVILDVKDPVLDRDCVTVGVLLGVEAPLGEPDVVPVPVGVRVNDGVRVGVWLAVRVRVGE